MDVRRQHDFVLLDKEPRRLQTHEQILFRGDLGLPLTDLCAESHCPAADFPAGELFRHRQRNLGEALFVRRDGGCPKRSVGEVLADRRLHGVRQPASAIVVGNTVARFVRRFLTRASR